MKYDIYFLTNNIVRKVMIDELPTIYFPNFLPGNTLTLKCIERRMYKLLAVGWQ